MNPIDFTGVSDSLSEEGFTKYLDFGVQEVTITKISFGESAKQKPYVELVFENNDGQFKDKFYLTVPALPRLKNLLLILGINESILNTEVTEKQLENFLIDKNVRILIGGKEYVNNTGQVKTAKILPYSEFAESINVPRDKTNLIYDSNKHIKRLVRQFEQLGDPTEQGDNQFQP